MSAPHVRPRQEPPIRDHVSPELPRRVTAGLVLLTLGQAVLPAVPALARGDLLGQPYTDLYPSVWGMWAFAQASELLPTHTSWLGFPEGIGFYYSSPLHGWLARLLLPVLSLTSTWNLLVVASRVATVALTWAAARAFGLRPVGAATAVVVLACSPFFTGYAVEGIVEGTDGWTLALWALAVGARRPVLSVLAMALTIVSSWYLGAAALLLAALAAPWHRTARWSLLGLVPAAPFIVAFAHAFPGASPLDPSVRAAMGAPLTLRAPGILPGTNPFARTTWIGAGLPLLLLAGRSRLALLALVPAVLSLGRGPWYELPVLELLRFPYRWHAATLAILALAAGRLVDAWLRGGRRWVVWLPVLLWVEATLLSPIEPVIPGAPADHPAILAQVDGPLLDIPGPVAMPPGQINRSRPRARYLLWDQVVHQQPSPWVPDFNGVGVVPRRPALDAIAAWDPLVSDDPPDALDPATVDWLRSIGVAQVMVHRRELGSERSASLARALAAAGLIRVATEGDRQLWRLPPAD